MNIKLRSGIFHTDVRAAGTFILLWIDSNTESAAKKFLDITFFPCDKPRANPERKSASMTFQGDRMARTSEWEMLI
jgi:hypothetical protein